MAKEHVHDVFESIAQNYDAANNRISLGLHSSWKHCLEKIAISACQVPYEVCDANFGEHPSGCGNFGEHPSGCGNNNSEKHLSGCDNNTSEKHPSGRGNNTSEKRPSSSHKANDDKSPAKHPINDKTRNTRVGMILDVCCGTGDITEHIAREHEDVLVVGLDFSESMLEVAARRTARLNNVMLINGNAMDLPFDDDVFDAAVISFGLRNTPDYKVVLEQMKRVTRELGIVACLDASVPDNKLVRPFYQFYYKHIMTLLGGGKSLHKEYEWLYESTQEFLSKEQLAALFEEVGLEQVTVNSFMCGSAALHAGIVPLSSSVSNSGSSR